MTAELVFASKHCAHHTVSVSLCFNYIDALTQSSIFHMKCIPVLQKYTIQFNVAHQNSDDTRTV